MNGAGEPLDWGLVSDISSSREKYERLAQLKYKYSLAPLSTKGSQTDPGGRFNIGAIDPTHFPVFSALYLAADKKTALAEILGRDVSVGGALSSEELALTKPCSVTAVSVSGNLESVLDIGETKNLVAMCL